MIETLKNEFRANAYMPDGPKFYVQTEDEFCVTQILTEKMKEGWDLYGILQNWQFQADCDAHPSF